MDGSPTVIEPTTSSHSPLPKIPDLSPHLSSSSDSFDSSRPNSGASSATTQSASPSPALTSVSAKDSSEHIELPALPSTASFPESTLTSQPHYRNDPPRSVPPASSASPRTDQRPSWLSRHANLIPTGQCLTNTLGALTFGLTLIGMIVFGRLTFIQVHNETGANCAQLLSANFSGPNCERFLKETKGDVILPRKHLKRLLETRIELYSSKYMSTDNTSGVFHYANFSSIAAMLASVIIGGLSLIVFRRYWSTEEVFTSPVRSDWHVTQHHEEGPETIGEGYRMIRRNPEDDHPLGQLRQHIRNSQPNAVENPTGEPKRQSHNTSQETFIGPWKDTKFGNSTVSLTNDKSDEKHENLIELETKGPNKTFFDPETGEFVHLTPWKSTGDEEVHRLRPDGKGSIKRAFAQMTLGATGWAGGKSIDDLLAEELQANSKSEEKEPDEPKAGDCITGDLINGSPSAKSIVA